MKRWIKLLDDIELSTRLGALGFTFKCKGVSYVLSIYAEEQYVWANVLDEKSHDFVGDELEQELLVWLNEEIEG